MPSPASHGFFRSRIGWLTLASTRMRCCDPFANPSRPYRVAMHSLVATLFLIVAAQVTIGGLSAGPSPRPTHQIAIATPPLLPVTNATLSVPN